LVNIKLPPRSVPLRLWEKVGQREKRFRQVGGEAEEYGLKARQPANTFSLFGTEVRKVKEKANPLL